MEKLPIGAVVYRLRKNKKVTQEDLASHVGVSPAAVSKWESGFSYPDITLLPRLAMYFNVAIDTLLDFTLELPDETANEIYLACEKLFAENKTALAFETCEDYLNRYMNSDLLKFKISSLFLLYGFKLKDKDEGGQLLWAAVRLFEDIANNCSDSNLVETSLFQLGSLYSSLGEDDKAIESLEKIQRIPSDPNDIIAGIYLQQGKLTEARKLMQSKLFKCFHELSLMCSGLAESYLTENNAALVDKYHRLSISAKQLLSPEGDGVLALANEYYSSGEAYVKLNKNREALQMFQKMTEHLQRNDLNRFGDISDVWCFSELKSSEFSKPVHMNLYEIFSTLFQQPIYDSLRDDEEFANLVSILKELEENRNFKP